MTWLTLSNPTLLLGAIALVALTVLTAVLRRPGLPRAALTLIGAGLLLLAFAAGGPVWRRPLPEPVVVMVDLSPSTRTAAYRDRAALEKRLGDLLGDRPYRLSFFAGARGAGAAAHSPARLPDLPADRTRYAPPVAPAVILFSDGRFDLPGVAPPTYVVIDPNLDAAEDAAVTELDVRPGEIAITTYNSMAAARPLRLSGTGGASDGFAAPGSVVTTRPVPAGSAGAVTARVGGGDAWPENDVLSTFIPPPPVAEHWWVGEMPAPDPSWRAIGAGQLPADPSAYLAPSIIALNNVAATDLSDAQQQRLQQYVRDLGGGLLILGGDHAFAAGDYGGSLLEQLSPLASTPPEPTNRWVLLVDSSGSMSAPLEGGGGQTRWRQGVDAAKRVLPSLPPADVVSVGGFSSDVDWWIRQSPARTAAGAPLPPPGAGPRGRTELRAALEAVAASLDAALPTQLLILTDGEADLGDLDVLAGELADKRVRLHLLLIGDAGPAADPMRQLAKLTGGTSLLEADPQRWADAARKLARAARPELLGRSPLTVRFTGDAAAVAPRTVSLWNRTWLKPRATGLAEGTSMTNERVPAAARRGDDDRVIAVAFPPGGAEIGPLARLAERPPRDPRFHVTWETRPKFRVTVDATASGQFLNDVPLSLQLIDEQGSSYGSPTPLRQTAPGRYRAELDPPDRPLLALVKGPAGVTLDRASLAGRYAPEFDAVGNDRRAMRELATRTGGAVIEPGNHGPLALLRPRRDVPLTSWLATLAACLVAAGLVTWRLT